MSGHGDLNFPLEDFAIDSAELKPEHKKRLNAFAFDISHTIYGSKREMWLIKLVGRASLSGEDEYNKELSRRRGESVKKYLDTILIGVPRKIDVIALGEESPDEKGIVENWKDRSVGVGAKLYGAIPPKIEPIDIEDILKPRLLPRKDFTLKVVSYLGQSLGVPRIPGPHVGRVAMNFIIEDDASSQKYTFMASSKGLMAGARVLGGVRSIERGKPQPFKAIAKYGVGDFHGAGVFFAVTQQFLFGGKKRGAFPMLRDFPMGTIDNFKFPKSLKSSLAGMQLRGEITKGFKPLVPEFPAPLPSEGIFGGGL